MPKARRRPLLRSHGRRQRSSGVRAEHPCVACTDYVNKPIALDASGSSDPDGKVVKADFTITDQAGNPVDKFMADAAPFS